MVKGIRVTLNIWKGVMILSLLILSLPVLVGLKPYKVMSGSMEPVLPIGALIYIRETNEIEEGEMVAFEVGNGQICVHRCMEIREDGTYVTKGDANAVQDVATVRKDQLIGKGVLVLPYAGYWVQFLQTPLGISVIIVCLLGSVAMESGIFRRKKDK